MMMMMLAVFLGLFMTASGVVVTLAAPIEVSEGRSGLMPILLGIFCFSMSALLWVHVGLRLAGEQ